MISSRLNLRAGPFPIAAGPFPIAAGRRLANETTAVVPPVSAAAAHTHASQRHAAGAEGQPVDHLDWGEALDAAQQVRGAPPSLDPSPPRKRAGCSRTGARPGEWHRRHLTVQAELCAHARRRLRPREPGSLLQRSDSAGARPPAGSLGPRRLARQSSSTCPGQRSASTSTCTRSRSGIPTPSSALLPCLRWAGPGTPPPQPAWRYAHLGDPPPAASRFHLRQCRACGRMRVLPRWADPKAPALRAAAFRCSANPDLAHAACSVPEFPEFLVWANSSLSYR